jgi:predicted MFS family arabinose efflux permease
VWGSFSLGIVALILFVIVESRSDAPMMPLGLFRSRTFSGANVLTFLLYGGLGGALFFLPFNLIQVQGYSPTAAGAALLPFVVIIFLLSRWSGALVDRVGAKWLLVIGPLLVAVATLLYVVPTIGGSYWTTFFPAIALQGVGMALTVAPLTTVVMTSVDVNHVGLASGINNAVSRAAALLSLAILGIIVLAVFSAQLDARLAAIPIPVEVQQALDAQRVQLAAAQVPDGVDPEAAAAIRSAIAESFVAGFRLAMWVAAVMALAGALTAFFTIESPSAEQRRQATAVEAPAGT